MRPTRSFSLPFLFALLLGLAACGGASRRGPAAPAEPRTVVRVDNRKFLDVNVYVINGTQRIRLGTVPGATTRSLTIPPNLLFGISSLRFQADPIGSREQPLTQEISVRPGDTVVLVISG